MPSAFPLLRRRGVKIYFMKKLAIVFMLTALFACKKDNDDSLRYFEVGRSDIISEWRDTSFVVATSDPALLTEIAAQLQLPVDQRKIVNGALEPGYGGYNVNASHEFKWHFKEDDWKLGDVSAEIYDGRPYTDIDLNTDYWMDTIKRFSPWKYYIKREIQR